MSNIGINIKKIREEKGLTQEQVANFVGKSKNVVSNWENGLNRPDADTIELLLALFEVDANTLFDWNDKTNKQKDVEIIKSKIESSIKEVLPDLNSLSSEDVQLISEFVRRLIKK